jgi:hypothetical protein
MRIFYNITTATVILFSNFVAIPSMADELISSPISSSKVAENITLQKISVIFQDKVTKRIQVPLSVQNSYGMLVSENLSKSGYIDFPAQFIIVVDRNPHVQTAFIFWLDKKTVDIDNISMMLIGAAPIASGSSGKFDHYITPTGVFRHAINNPDYRAEGTKNENGIMGYGKKGMRVYDFGWQDAEKAWGKPDIRKIRFQMHATDPGYLESRLGTPGSKGCVRIPSQLNEFIDHFGIIDAEYDQSIARGEKLWVLKKDREQTPWSGSLLIVVDSGETNVPLWLKLKK